MKLIKRCLHIYMFGIYSKAEWQRGLRAFWWETKVTKLLSRINIKFMCCRYSQQKQQVEASDGRRRLRITKNVNMIATAQSHILIRVERGLTLWS